MICSKLCSLIDINFAEQYVGLFLGHFLEGGFEGFARTTPLSIPVGYHKLPCGLQVFEVFLRTNTMDLARRKVTFWPAGFEVFLRISIVDLARRRVTFCPTVLVDQALAGERFRLLLLR